MSDHEYWNELGNLYFMNGAYEPAVHAYLRSIQLDGKFGKSYSNLALTFVYTGKYAEAIKLYRRSIEFLTNAKDKAITWNRLGALYRQVRDYQNALAAYQQADVLDPQQGNTKIGSNIESNLPLTVSMPAMDINSILEDKIPKEINVGLQPVRTKAKMQVLEDGFVPLDPEQIRRELEVKAQTVEVPTTGEVEWKLAYAEDSAFSKETASAEGNPNMLNESPGEGIQPGEEVFDTKKDLEQVETPTENSQRLESDQTTSTDMTNFEVVQYSQTEYLLPELSNEEFNSIKHDIAKYKAETINNPRNVSAWERLGDAYKSAGMYKEAIQAIKTAISNNSTKPAYYYRLGLMYAAERREAEAVLAFEKVLELNPNHALAHASLGGHYRKLGMDELAQTHINKALNTNFENENVYNRACLEAICGNTDRALELLEIALQTKQTYIKWIKNDPDLDSLHEDQRFIALLSSHAAV